MADIADIASEIQERHLEVAMANRPKWTGVDMSAAECEECGDEIPSARRQAVPWAKTCIECQQILERRKP
ncbi:TraR/DksA C4-type zinc finger protein [Halomonas cupida]|uniref:TraR/DksA C4-type zinc finger protein n=1 Tax=Halomonas cupida TaxID=44933 RepID=UPI003A8CA67A